MYTAASAFLWSMTLGLLLGLMIFIVGIYYERLRKLREDKKIAAQLEFERRLAACEAITALRGASK